MRITAKIVLLAASIGIGCSIPASHAVTPTGERATFTGHIDAYYELRYAKIVSRENIVFTVDHDAIQRIVYVDNDHYMGLVVYPLENNIMLFRQSGPLKFYTVLNLADHEAELATQLAKRSLDDIDRIGFSDHFLALLDTTPTAAANTPAPVHDNQPCARNAWKQEKFASDTLYVAEHCAHIGIPHAWLRYTDLNIPEQATGFPFLFTKQAIDNNTTSTSVFGPTENADSTTGKMMDFAGKAIRKASRAVDELKEFTYRVVKVAPGPVKKVDFINLLDFVRVDSLELLKKSFPDHPDYVNPEDHSRSSSRGHSGFSDMFD